MSEPISLYNSASKLNLLVSVQISCEISIFGGDFSIFPMRTL